MAKYRQRFNDKARAGGVAKRNALRAKRQKQFHHEDHDHEPSNGSIDHYGEGSQADALFPLTQAEKEEKKRKISDDLYSKQETKTSRNKRKRLDKYIDRQVKRQERDEIFAKLAHTRVDTGHLQPLSRLGTGSQAVSTAPEKSGSSDENESEDEDDGDGDEDEDEEYERENKEEKSNVVSAGEKNGNYTNVGKAAVGGFGFKDLPTIAKNNKTNKPKKASWRELLGEQEEDSKSEDETAESEFEGFSDNSSESSESEEISESNMPDNSSDAEEDPHKKGKEFVSWARSLEPDSGPIPTQQPLNYKHVPRPAEVDLEAPPEERMTVKREATYHVDISRTPQVQSQREHLPAIAQEQEIMEAIHNNDVVVLTGETGSGKTTQVPQFLYEAGFGTHIKGMIGITQPRRVAAVSMAKRVGEELGPEHGSHVGYQIRFDTRVGDDTRVKFMTDGVLLREMSSDFELSKYSALIVDEAHERSVNTDILLGLLSRIVRLRREKKRPLKLVVMSATLRVSDFVDNRQLFLERPPVVSVESRQYPVSMHFSRRTSREYVKECIAKALKIHTRLPKGGILIFLTGQNEITQACKLLHEASGSRADAVDVTVRASAQDDLDEEAIDLNFGSDTENSDNDSDHDEEDEESDEEGFEEEYDGEETKLHVLPLYSLLPTSQQMKVFEKPPKGHRLCVVATNVAETSLTIPGIRYVVDSGRVKQRVYENNVQKFKVSWISKAAANQRAGRAGRTGPGHCYGVYSSAVYERDFPQFSDPEIQRMPIESLVLQMKSMGIHHITNFPFPSPPSSKRLEQGIFTLKVLGALDNDGAVTPIGQQMNQFPLHPRHSKMLLIGNQHNCLPYVVALVAALSVGDPMMSQWELPSANDGNVHEKEKARAIREAWGKAQSRLGALDPRSDAFRLLAAIAGYSFAKDRDEFCQISFLRAKVMFEIEKLRGQLSRLVATATRPDAVDTVAQSLVNPLSIPEKVQLLALKQILAAGYIDQVAVRADLVEETAPTKIIMQTPYLNLEDSQRIFIHPSSILGHSGSQPPEYLVYSALTASDDAAKIRLRPLVDISAAILGHIASGTPLITFSKPLMGAYAPTMINPTRRQAWVVPHIGAVSLDLPARKVIQVRRNGEWVTEL